MLSVFLLLAFFAMVLVAVVNQWPADILGLLFFMFLLIVALQCVLIYHIHIAVARLRHFAGKAERNLLRKSDFTTPFPDNELGEVAQHIIMLYRRLSEAKEALYIEKEKMAIEQEEKGRLKRQLTHNIAHELKTPVSNLHGYLETLIYNRNISREQLDHFLDACYAQSCRLIKLVNDISLLVRLDEASERLSKEVVDVTRIVKKVFSDMSLQMEEHHVLLHNELNHPLPVYGNESLIYSIFHNLLDNAIAYAGDESEIWVSCYREDEEFYYFRFADNGAGVDSHHLFYLFGRFYRTEKKRSDGQKGTGLGLSIVKNAILFHGGTISVRNRKSGGLEFDFTLSSVIQK